MNTIESERFSLNGSVVCIGKFDGIHLGHQELLRYATEAAHRQSLYATMFTFLFEHQTDIYTESEKVVLAKEFGIDTYLSYPFSKEIKEMSPEVFVREMLVKKCNAKLIVAGEDFCFGYKRGGNVSTLEQLAEKYKFQVKVFQKLSYQEKEISSTRIRKALLDGKIKLANAMLGRPFFFEGKVILGNQIGRTLDMPTANLIPGSNKLLPARGVYASFVTIGEKGYYGVTNIGKKPTIPGRTGYGIETYIFDFDSNIYGEKIRVELLDYLRPEQKFSDLDELKWNMHHDKESAMQVFSHIGE